MIDWKEIYNTRNLVGWLGDVEVDNLYKFAQEAPTNRAVEIGSFCGKSAVVMGLALKERNGSLLCIDNCPGGFDFYPNGYPDPSGIHWWIPSVKEEFFKNIRKYGLESVVTHLWLDARYVLPAMNGKFGLIFIDADHTIRGCLNDALWAYDHIEPSGYIVFHDYHNVQWGDGVTKSVDALKHIWQGEWTFYWGTAAFKKS